MSAWSGKRERINFIFVLSQFYFADLTISELGTSYFISLDRVPFFHPTPSSLKGNSSMLQSNLWQFPDSLRGVKVVGLFVGKVEIFEDARECTKGEKEACSPRLPCRLFPRPTQVTLLSNLAIQAKGNFRWLKGIVHNQQSFHKRPK